jgi:hypothetical protein
MSFVGIIGAAVFLPADWATGLAADHQQPTTHNRREPPFIARGSR